MYATIIGLCLQVESLGKGWARARRLAGLCFCTGGAIFVILVRVWRDVEKLFVGQNDGDIRAVDAVHAVL